MEAASYLDEYNRKAAAKPVQRRERLSDTVFDKPKSSSAPAVKKDLSEILVSRPKAVVRKKETPDANKPYIAKSLDGLTKGAPVMAAGGPGYAEGDRVQHVKYGVGTVLNIVQDTRDYKVTVNFDGYGNKIMYAAFAKLKKI